MRTPTGPMATTPTATTATTATTEETSMSTTATVSPPETGPARLHRDVAAYPPGMEDVPPLPFTRLLGTELRKLLDTRSGRWLLVAILVITALAMGATLWVNRETGTGLLALLAAANIPQALLIPVLGILTAANEWSQRTALITFTQEPRRLRVMTAKTIAVVLLGLAVLVVTTLLAAGAHTVSSLAVDGADVELWLGWPLVLHLLLLQTLGVLMGVAFGALLLNVPLGIVAYFLVPTLSPLIFMTTAWLRENAGWLDLSVAQGALLGEEWLTGQQWAQLASTTALWVLLPLTVGFWRVARREVK